MNRRVLFVALVSLFFLNWLKAQVIEGFNSTTFPPLGWTASASSGTTQWSRIVSSTRNSSAGAASSLNPAAGVSKYLTLSMNASSNVVSLTFYSSVSSVTKVTGASLKVYGGTDTTALSLLKSINLEDSTLFTIDTYVQFIVNIDGTLALGQTGSVDLRSHNPAYIRWSHQKTSGSAASCRLEDVEIQNAVPLPVQLTAFTAAVQQRDVYLHWSTVTETYNYGFDIQRRQVCGTSELTVSESEWATLGFVQGHGTCFTPKEYSFLDGPIPSGRYAYRLRQIDYDGSVEYHGPVEVEVGLTRKMFWLSECFPNPCNPATSIAFTLPSSARAELNVYDYLGRKVSTLFNNIADAGRLQIVQFNASHLPSGLYIVRLVSGGESVQKKVLVLK
ncbi:MAG: T9SS type A sorting domain-containing protein [bacterium]